MAFFGVVDEVFRRSRKRTMDEEVDAYDGDVDEESPLAPEGVTYAQVTILRSEPPLQTAPIEQSPVWLGEAAEAALAYGYDEMVDQETGADWGLPIGLIRNGGEATAGVAKLDWRDLSGDRAGHLNVTGQAGRGTKSSFLLMVVRSLLDFARSWDNGDPNRQPLSVRPIVFNVKGNDLMYLDQPNRYLTAGARRVWEELGLEARPFTSATFHAPCSATRGHVNRGLPRVLRAVPEARQTRAYYWTLADVIRFDLWTYLFSDQTQQSETLMALVDHLLGLLAEDCPIDAEHPAGLRLRRPDGSNGHDGHGTPQSFGELRDWMHDALRDKSHPARDNGVHTFGTCRALMSRLTDVLGLDGRPIFDDGPGTGQPLRVLASGTTDPLVIDIATLPNELRRFVVAAVLNQVKAQQIGDRRTPGQVYFLVLDELGIYAPRGARDPITRLFEHVAAQLRSQGIILLGAQQQASKVSETIFGNSEVKAVGATSPVELETPTWSHLLTGGQKARALLLQPEEKMVLNGRGWMHVLVPFPAWAMKEAEVGHGAPAPAAADGGAAGFPLNLPES